MKPTAIACVIAAVLGGFLIIKSFGLFSAPTNPTDASSLQQAYEHGELSSTAASILTTNKKAPELMLLAANCYRQLQKPNAFLSMLAEAEKQGADSDQLEVLVLLERIQSGDFNGSGPGTIAMLKKRGVPQVDARRTVVTGYMMRGDSETMKKLITQWQLRDPQSKELHYMRALLAISQSNFSDGESLLLESITGNPQHELSFIMLAKLYSNSPIKYSRKCRFVYEQTLLRFPKNEDIAIQLSRICRMQGDTEAALRSLETLGTETLESGPEVLLERAEIALERGQYQKSVELMRKRGATASQDVAKIIDEDFGKVVRGSHDTQSMKWVSTLAISTSLRGQKDEATRLLQFWDDRSSRLMRYQDLQPKLSIFPGNKVILNEMKSSVEPAFHPGCPSMGGVLWGEPKRTLSEGERLFHEHCAACHGNDGNGSGRAAKNLFPAPRNFREEPIRMVSTVNRIASDEDIAKTIREGLGGASMPAFPKLTSEQIDQLIAVIRKQQVEGLRAFYQTKRKEMGAEENEIDPHGDAANRWIEEHSTPGAPLPIPDFTSADQDDSSRGPALLERAACNPCHAVSAEGGDRQLSFYDSLGRPLLIRHLETDPFRGGNSRKAIYQRIVLGIPGTPHPELHGLAEQDLIDLVEYIHQLSTTTLTADQEIQSSLNFQRRLRLLPSKDRHTSIPFARHLPDEAHQATDPSESKASLSAPKQSDQEADSFVSLFDGQSMAGWEGDEKWFRIEKGAIVAGSMDQSIPHNYFLCSTKSYSDFELRLEVKIVGPGKNAGVQFRSKRLPDSTEIIGYQADAGRAFDRSVWGALYDESRRKTMLAEGDPDLVKRLTKVDDWNELRIVARGKHVEIYLNGEQTIDYTERDDSIETVGVIGLQIHSGPATEAWYRNIRIRELIHD